MSIKGVKELVAEANLEITTLSCAEALSRQSEGDAVLVDIRDIRELNREGRVKDAVHAPRGMLEFWFDPASPYHKEVFADETKDYVLFCASAWRSALAAKTLKDMGFSNIAHVEGGFTALKEVAEIQKPPELK
jgi:rhodanese-related sulfurtransferase